MPKICLKVGGKRSAVTVQEAAEIKTRFQVGLASNDNPVVTKLDLSGRIWDVKALQVLDDVLRKIAPTVEILRIDDIVVTLPTEDGLATYACLAALFGTSPLIEINLNDNAIGSRGIEVLQPILNLPTLKRLYLDNTGLSAETGSSLQVTLAPVANQLEAISLSRNQMGRQGAKCVGQLLQDCHRLQAFSYAGTRPLVDGTRFICQGLVHMAMTTTASSTTTTSSHNNPSKTTTTASSSLIHLNLGDCDFQSGQEDSDPVHDLCRLLRASPKLQHLDLGDGMLEAKGAKLVMDALDGVHLVHLNIGGNDIGVHGAKVLADFLATQTWTLRHLNASSNELTDEGVLELLAPLGATQTVLQHLDLELNEITGVAGRALLGQDLKLHSLILTDNSDLPLSVAKALQKMFPKVLVDDDLEDDDDDDNELEDDDVDVDDLEAMMGSIKI